MLPKDSAPRATEVRFVQWQWACTDIESIARAEFSALRARRRGRVSAADTKGVCMNTWGGHYMGGGGYMMILGVVAIVAIVWIASTRSRRDR